MAIDTKTLYDFVQFVANKEQAGFITTDEFEQAADSAQLELIRDRLGNPNSTQPGRPVPMGGYGTSQLITDDLRHLITHNYYSSVTVSNAFFGTSLNFTEVALQSDHLYLLNVTQHSNLAYADRGRRPVKIVDFQEFWAVLDSALFRPTGDYPYGVIADDKVYIFPHLSTGSDVNIQYIKRPVKGTLTETINATTGAISVSTNQALSDMPESLFNELAWRILSLFGLNLRDAQITQYAEGQEKEVM